MNVPEPDAPNPRPPLRELANDVDLEVLGARMHEFARELMPLHRSITGAGLRHTLACISRRVPLELTEIASGTAVLDWVIPREWSIREAWIKGPDGSKVVDLAWSTLHVVSYSVPVHERLSLEALRPHLHTIPEQPSLIPYRTTYYEPGWGFCLAQETLDAMEDGEYEVLIDSSLEPGSLTLGEAVIGSGKSEILFSMHICHPALANDNLSAVVTGVALAEILAAADLRCRYRFIFAPATIGAIAWLATHLGLLTDVRAGLVLAGVGDPGQITYKHSRSGDSLIDRTVTAALADLDIPYGVRPFTPLGYDERQYGSPGFALAVGSIMRTPPGEYPEYHTSADDLDFVTPGALAGSLAALLRIVVLLEENETLRNTAPYGEPQLGRRGLYDPLGGVPTSRELQRAVLWVLSLSDGNNDLLGIAERSGISFTTIREAADLLSEKSLLVPVDP